MTDTDQRVCDHCQCEFTPTKANQRFCCAQHKAAWHREQPFKNGVEVTITTSRTNKRGLFANIKMSLQDQERFSKMNLQNCRVFLVPVPDEP